MLKEKNQPTYKAINCLNPIKIEYIYEDKFN